MTILDALVAHVRALHAAVREYLAAHEALDAMGTDADGWADAFLRNHRAYHELRALVPEVKP